MKWSWKIGRIAGVSIYVHVTFLILLAWVGARHYLLRHSGADAIAGLGFILALFGIVVLHELGHALMARRYGIPTLDITLLPIGGVARLERMPEEPKQELLVALAGPAVNVVLAIGLFVLLMTSRGVGAMADVAVVGGDVISKLMWVNVGLAVFNLLPAFPMDGGRVLRALLATRTSYVRATHIAANIGQGMALLFGFFGLFSNPFLVFIALFVWMGAAQEASMVELKSALGGVPVERVMMTRFRTLGADDPLSRAVEQILAGSQQDFPVVDGAQVVGVLTRADLLEGLGKAGGTGLVREHMQREFRTAARLEMAENVFARLQNCACRTIPVLEGGELVGMVTPENIGEFMMIQAALQGKPPKISSFAGSASERRAA